MAEHVSEFIRGIGADDHSLQKFEHQYRLCHGMSYNSYVILDDKVAVLDTIDEHCRAEWVLNLEHALNGRTPDYLVVHHMEPDHSAAIGYMMERFPGLKIVASRAAIAMLPQFFIGETYGGRCITVREGDSLALGKHTLRFIAAPMVHWPEVMMSYEESEGVLFSADAFGKFGSVDYHDEWLPEARRYYANVVGRYGPQVQSVLKKLTPLKIAAIAPLHGPVLRGDLSPYIHHYDLWSSYTPETKGALVAYASIYGGTALCARLFAEMLRQRDVEVTELDLTACDDSEAVAQAFRLSCLVVAAPTYDTAVFPPMADFLHRLRLKNLQNRQFGVIENGSWAPSSGRLMAAALLELKDMEQIEPMVSIRSKMRPADRGAMMVLADAVAERCR